jgi:exodeoxyribonuclease VII small subunit
MVKKSTAENGTAPESFEQAMAELAQLVTQMEAGQLPLEASVAAYARGSELVKYCAAQLEKVEAQVKVLEGDMLKPFVANGAETSDEGAQ